MDQQLNWWLTATTPGGVHLWELTPEQVDTDTERDALIAAVRAELGMPGDPTLMPPEGWSLDFAPGRPDRRFDDAGDPLPGVTVHIARGAS